MKHNLILVLMLIALPVSLLAQNGPLDERVRFDVTLSPTNEVPPITDVEISGTARIGISFRAAELEGDPDLEDDNGGGEMQELEVEAAVVDFNVTLNTAEPVTFVAMHIHRGVRGQNGPVVVDSQFGMPLSLEPGTHTIFRSVEITDIGGFNVIEDILANPTGYYLNLHSTSHPPGLVRDQLRELPDVIRDRDHEGLGQQLDEVQAELAAIKELVRRIAAALGVLRRGE